MKIWYFGVRIPRQTLHGRGIRILRTPIVGSLALVFIFQLPLAAKCPAIVNATVVVRAPIGNLQVDTTGTDSIEVLVSNSLIQVQEKCGRDSIEISSNTPDTKQIQGTIDWRILVPKTVNLDLVTLAGSITAGDLDGSVVLRTTGGSVTTGRIQGRAAIITQGGSIRSGNIGGNAELRSQGGSLEVGDVAGDAEFQTAGPIRAGAISGRVVADTAGGTIFIKEARGEVIATTRGGDITIGDAARINATTSGGNIISRRVRGSFQGRTESGDIRLDSAGAWVEASTGFGNIIVRLVPDKLDADLHVNLQSGIGDVTVFLPQRMKATVEATVERPAFSAQRIISDFPMNAMTPPGRGLVPNRFYAPTRSRTELNGGGNRITLHTSLGKIEIKKQ